MPFLNAGMVKPFAGDVVRFICVSMKIKRIENSNFEA